MSADIGARVYHDTNQNIAANAYLPLTFNSERWDTDGIHDGVNPTRLTCQTAGYYYIAGTCTWAGVSTTYMRTGGFDLNGAGCIARGRCKPTSNIPCRTAISTLYYLEVGDYLEYDVRHDSTTNPLAILSVGNYSPEFSMQLVEEVGARVWRNSNQSCGNGAIIVISFTTEEWDTDAVWDGGTPTRLTCQTDGTYIITGCVNWQSRLQGGRVLTVRLNGDTNIASRRNPGVSSGFGAVQALETVYQLSAGDYIELLAYQNSGIALNVASSAQWSPMLAMQKVRDV